MATDRKILFDSRYLGASVNGISRDSQYFLEYLASANFEVIALSYNHNYKFLQLNFPDVPQIRLGSLKLILFKELMGISIKISSIYSDFYLFKPQISPLQVITKNSRLLRTITRVHDLFPKTHPEWFTLKSKIYFYRGLKHLAKSDFLIANSEYTKKELRKFLDSSFKDQNLVVIRCQINVPPSSRCDECIYCKKRISFPKNSHQYLTLGTFEPRKNYRRLVIAWLKSGLFRYNSILLIVGRRGWKHLFLFFLVKKMGKFLKIFWLSGICDYSIKELLHSTDVYINISLDEGFDLPFHETSGFDLIRIVSNIPAHQIKNNPKISVAGLFYLNPYDLNSIVDTMIHVRNLGTSSAIQMYLDPLIFNIELLEEYFAR